MLPLEPRIDRGTKIFSNRREQELWMDGGTKILSNSQEQELAHSRARTEQERDELQ